MAGWTSAVVRASPIWSVSWAGAPGLLLLQAVFGEAQRRGYGVVPTKHESYGPPAGVAIDLRGHRYAVEVTELTDRVASPAV